jgi:trimeric autotransporter adhesin
MLPRLYILVLGWLAVAVPLTFAQMPEGIPTPPEVPTTLPTSVTPPTSAGLFDPASLTPEGVTDYWGRFRPRGTYRYEAGDSIGRTNGLSSLQAFVPFWEPNSLQGLAFVDARFLLFDNQTTPGTNVGMGFRSVVPSINRTLGGHVSYDLTDTGLNVFHQVSGGVETLGSWLDARANFYAPLGGQRRLIGSSFAANSGAIFQGQNLMFGGGTLSNSYEYAMSGFDTEVGGRVVRFGSVDLRAFVGTYYFGVDNGPDTWGGRARVEAKISDTIALALSVQRDKLFDTTVNLQVTLSWPSLTGRRRDDRGDSTPMPGERLGESVERIQNVVVSRGVERVVVAREAALDPFTGAPFVFIHVAPGGNSDGSFENPYSTLEKAIHDPRFAAGNIVVYDRTLGTYTGNVTLAPGTRLLSSGPVQAIDTLNGGRLTLPFSGSDPTLSAIPQIHGTVFLSSGSTLSGYRVTGPTGPSLAQFNGPAADLLAQAPGSQVRDIRIDNNVLVGGNIGVNLFNVAGNVDIVNNRLQNQNLTGINVQAQHDDTASIRITDNVVGGSGLNGIYMTVNDVLGMRAKVDTTIQRNQISNTGNAGISITAGASSRLDASIANNSVANAAGSGIEVLTSPGNATIHADIIGNLVSRSGANSAGGIVIGANSPAGLPSLTARVLDNKLTDNFTSGFSASAGPGNSLALDLRGNSATSANSPNDFVFDRFRGLLQVVDLLDVGKMNTGKVDVTSAPVANITTLP